MDTAMNVEQPLNTTERTGLDHHLQLVADVFDPHDFAMESEEEPGRIFFCPVCGTEIEEGDAYVGLRCAVPYAVLVHYECLEEHHFLQDEPMCVGCHERVAISHLLGVDLPQEA
ncbi:MAG: hypothetical protein LC650_01310 [Actinobacteria bacterium]|nr:hypothetical protein [Actinomycetota bacterium]